MKIVMNEPTCELGECCMSMIVFWIKGEFLCMKMDLEPGFEPRLVRLIVWNQRIFEYDLWMNVRNEEENGVLTLKILKIISGQNLENGP